MILKGTIELLLGRHNLGVSSCFLLKMRYWLLYNSHEHLSINQCKNASGFFGFCSDFFVFQVMKVWNLNDIEVSLKNLIKIKVYKKTDMPYTKFERSYMLILVAHIPLWPKSYTVHLCLKLTTYMVVSFTCSRII